MINRLFSSQLLAVTALGIMLSGCSLWFPEPEPAPPPRFVRVETTETASQNKPTLGNNPDAAPYSAPRKQMTLPQSHNTTMSMPDLSILNKLEKQDPMAPFRTQPPSLDARITRIEAEVVSIRDDLRALAPVLKQFMGYNHNLMIPDQAKTVKTSPKTVKNAAPKAKTDTFKLDLPPPGGDGVNRIRLGEHTDKTRIVFDVIGDTKYSFDLDNSENLLIVEIPERAWLTQMEGKAKKSPLVHSFLAQQREDGGSRVIIQLKHNARVIQDSMIKATKDNPYNRIVLDLRGDAVHK